MSSSSSEDLKRFCCKKCKKKYNHARLTCPVSFLENECHQCGAKGCVHHIKVSITIHVARYYCTPCWEPKKIEGTLEKGCLKCSKHFICMGIAHDICDSCYIEERSFKRNTVLKSKWDNDDIVFEITSQYSCNHDIFVGKATEADIRLGYKFIKLPNCTPCGYHITKVTLLYPFQGYITLRETSSQSTLKYIVHLEPPRTSPDYKFLTLV